MDNTLTFGIDNLSGTSNSTSNYSPWGQSIKISTEIFEDRVEIVYKANSNITYTIGIETYNIPRIWKEIYRPIDGKIKLIETVEGQYHPAQEEYYTFE